jgi:hypothetical protein
MMKRLLLAGLLLWGATLIFPELGEGVQLRAVELWEWTGDRLEGPASPITNRYRRVQAENQLSKISRQLVLRRNQGQRPPSEEELAGFLIQHDISPDGLDPWGVAFRIVQEPDSVAVMSAGPDLTFGTEDDMVLRLRFRDHSRRRN